MRWSWLSLQLLLSCALLLAVVAVEGRHCKEEESSSEEECPCEKRHHCVEECCKKRCRHACCCEERHHHKDEECCKKKHPRVEESEADKKKGSHVGKKHPKKRHPFLKESEEASSESSEAYEHMAKEDQNRIMQIAAQDSEAVPHHRKEQAIAHFNRGSEGPYYKHLEDGQLEFQEAIGVVVYVKMLLGKTNCTRNKEQEDAGVEYSRAYLEKEGCRLLPKFQQEKHNCTFGIFINMRTEKKSVISQECSITPGIKLPIF